jgi:Type VI secretion system spike protein VgrG3-like, C-terminal
VQRIKSDCGLDVIHRSHALQDAVWSTAVQHGPNTPVITRAIEAVGGVDALPPGDLDGDRRLIRKIYDERGRKSADGGLVYFPRVTDKRIRQSLADRFVNEARDALAMLDRNA